MEAWRYIWRTGIAPMLGPDDLEALRDGLSVDDPALVQGVCVTRAEDEAAGGCVVTGGCAICYAIWNHGAVPMDDDVIEIFADVLKMADDMIGCPLAAEPFLSWYDDTPREDMRRELLAEVTRSIGRCPARRR